MTLKKDSLLLRIITYNAIAVILVSAVLALLFGIVTVKELNNRLLDKTREKVTILNKVYTSFVEDSERDVFNSITKSLNSLSIYDENKIQKKLAGIARNQLVLKSRSKYNNSYIQVISEKRELLSESGENSIKYDILDKTDLVPNIDTLEGKDYYFVGTDNNLYVRIVQAYRSKSTFRRFYFVLTVPITNYNLKKARTYINIKKDDKIFILSGNNCIYGELGKDKIKNFFRKPKKNSGKNSMMEYNYYFSERKIGDIPYYTGVTSFLDSNNNIVGSIGLAVPKKGFLAVKYMLATMILALSLISVIISIALCTRIFTRLLAPLSVLADKTKGIGIDENAIELAEEPVYEIRTIANSIKAMAERIGKNENLLKIKNEKLNSNLNRIIAVENVLMGIDIDRNFSDGADKILRALTSEIGFGYSRAIYFKYSEEINSLIAKELSINSEVSSNIEKYTKGVGGFNFQIKDLNNLLPLLKVKYEPGNLFWDSMDSGKIVFQNDKGYKFNFGNELFKSLGFSNFLLLPISDKDIKLGCILVDYFEKDKKISDEEVEVMKLLLMNLLIRVKNNLQEEKKLTSERMMVISKISNKFLEENENLVKKMETFIEKASNREYNSKDIEKINKFIQNKRKEYSIIKEIFSATEESFVLVNLEKLLNKIIEELKPEVDKYHINISTFFNFYGCIYGNEKKLYHMFVEVLKNSIAAILIRNKLDKKINIILNGIANDKVAIEIIDNGIGICKSELNQIIKPYYSDNKSALGLGLTMIYNTVREHKGLIRITSELDEGTKIRIIFKEYKEENCI